MIYLAMPVVAAIHAFVHTMGYGMGDIRSTNWRKASVRDAFNTSVVALIFYGVVAILLYTRGRR